MKRALTKELNGIILGSTLFSPEFLFQFSCFAHYIMAKEEEMVKNVGSTTA